MASNDGDDSADAGLELRQFLGVVARITEARHVNPHHLVKQVSEDKTALLTIEVREKTSDQRQCSQKTEWIERQSRVEPGRGKDEEISV